MQVLLSTLKNRELSDFESSILGAEDDGMRDRAAKLSAM